MDFDNGCPRNPACVPTTGDLVEHRLTKWLDRLNVPNR